MEGGIKHNFFFSSRRRHTRFDCDWSSDVCSSDLSGLGCHVRCRQTNHEGEYVEWCHDALDWADGVVVNPGAWTHYSYAIRDALELFDAPIVEVHLSNIDEREEWRRTSVVADLAAKRILGKGADGYREALEFIVQQVGAAR